MSQSEVDNESATNNGACNGSRPQDGSFRFLDYIREEWRSTIFVAACVTIAHLGFNWLDAVDGYAFMAVGNRVSQATAGAAAAAEPKSGSVVVVRIDEQTFRTRYRERTPLDRCVLSRQLGAIYQAKPHVVVVDLDLSPADWARHEVSPEALAERQCQTDLEKLLAKNVREGIRTVVMEPFDSLDSEVATRVIEWQQRLEREGIRFGDAALPVSYGMTIDYFTDDRSLYAAAARASVTSEVASITSAPKRPHSRIDVSAYTTKLQPVLTSWTDTPGSGANKYTDKNLTDTLLGLWPTRGSDGANNRFVFVGAGYGDEDTFVTPVGKLYGVEVHAAAFATEKPSSWCHPIALLLEIVIAFMFGMIIVYCWTQYFAWRSDQGSTYEHLASVWVGIMLAGLLAGIVLAVLISSQLLSRFGIWISPIPVAAGMLIESCMAGSVEAAVRRLHRIQAKLEARVPSDEAIAKLSTGFKRTVWVLALAGALRLVWSH
jgi:CHASE2 domain-containing sensor protein